MQNRLRLAVQKSGRLSEDSIELIKECGLRLDRIESRLKTQAYNFPLEILHLRDDDIPGYVEDGVADAGIAGENVVVEKNRKVDIVARLGFSKCRLAIAIPKSSRYQGLADLNGLNIATSYPHILNHFLDKNGIKASIHEISGAVEIAPSIGLAQAICDIVSSGSTLLSNGLQEVETIFNSEAVLIATPNLAKEKKSILHDLLFRIQAVLQARNFKYILLNVPNEKIDEVSALLPGMKSPTVTPLAQAGWSSLHSVVNENQFWEIIDSLRAAGAEGILVVPIEKMIL